MLSWTNVLNSWTSLSKARRLGPGRQFAAEWCWLWRHRFPLWKFYLYSIFWIRYHLRKNMEHIMWRFRKYEQNMFGQKCVTSSRVTPIILWLLSRNRSPKLSKQEFDVFHLRSLTSRSYCSFDFEISLLSIDVTRDRKIVFNKGKWVGVKWRRWRKENNSI